MKGVKYYKLTPQSVATSHFASVHAQLHDYPQAFIQSPYFMRFPGGDNDCSGIEKSPDDR